MAYSAFLDQKSDNNRNIRNVCIVWFLKFTLSLIKSNIERTIVPDFLSFIRTQMFSAYLKKNQVDFNDVDVSSDVKQILEITKHTRDLLLWSCQTIIPIIILVLSINIYFLVKAPAVGVLTIVNNLSCAYLIRRNHNKLMKKVAEREGLFLKMTEKINENFSNMMNIFLNNKVEDSITDNRNIEKEYVSVYMQEYKDLENFAIMIRICNYTFAGICLYVLYKTTSREQFINSLLIFTFYLSSFEGFLEDIPHFIHILLSAQFNEECLEKKFQTSYNVNPTYTKNLSNYNGSITFNNVSFSYKPEASKIFDNLSLTINPGDRIAIVSKSGSGKTTMMKLILSFYKPNGGTILLDGKNVNDIDPKEIRQKINYINQRTLLFQDTIMNNMKYGNTKTDEEIVSFLAKYDLLHIFRDCDKSPNTCLNAMVENNGTNISLGMQKIIFLVRGILKDDSTVYIFDEPLTSLDPSTRMKVLTMIKNETKGKTLLIITHDKEVETIVDRMINLKDLQLNNLETSNLESNNKDLGLKDIVSSDLSKDLSKDNNINNNIQLNYIQFIYNRKK
jgi:ABC-type multidrug transport system fused ATPase/permease subunit